MTYDIYAFRDYLDLMTEATQKAFLRWLRQTGYMLELKEVYDYYDDSIDGMSSCQVGTTFYAGSAVLKELDRAVYDKGFTEFVEECYFEFTSQEQDCYMDRCNFYDLFDEFTDDCCFACSACSKYTLADAAEYISEEEYYCEECQG